MCGCVWCFMKSESSHFNMKRQSIATIQSTNWRKTNPYYLIDWEPCFNSKLLLMESHKNISIRTIVETSKQMAARTLCLKFSSFTQFTWYYDRAPIDGKTFRCKWTLPTNIPIPIPILFCRLSYGLFRLGFRRFIIFHFAAFLCFTRCEPVGNWERKKKTTTEKLVILTTNCFLFCFVHFSFCLNRHWQWSVKCCK